MSHGHSIAALGAAAALAGCVGGGPVTEDWTEESRAAARTGLATMIEGTLQVVTGSDGYLDPAEPPAQLSGLGARMLIDGLLAVNAAETASSVAEWSTDLPTAPVLIEAASAD